MFQSVSRSDAPITQQFGINPAAYVHFGFPGHNGLDLALPEGTQLYSPIDGWVIEVGNDPSGYGLYVKVGYSDGGAHYLLAHLSDWGATGRGDYVQAGTPIALSGSTGNSTGPHVHIGYRPRGLYRRTPYSGWVDPEPFLAQ